MQWVSTTKLEARDDTLPTYDSVISQGEKLPEYKSRRKYLRSQQRVYNNNSNNSSPIDINDTVQHIIKRGSYQQSVSDTYKHLSTHFAQQPLIAEIKFGERSLKEFCAITWVDTTIIKNVLRVALSGVISSNLPIL